MCVLSHRVRGEAEDIFDSLQKDSKVAVERKWVRFERSKILSLSPSQALWLTHVLAESYPAGVLVVHVDLRSCCWFRPRHPPALVSVRTGIELLRGRLALGLALCGNGVSIVQVGTFNKRYRKEIERVLS